MRYPSLQSDARIFRYCFGTSVLQNSVSLTCVQSGFSSLRNLFVDIKGTVPVPDVLFDAVFAFLMFDYGCIDDDIGN